MKQKSTSALNSERAERAVSGLSNALASFVASTRLWTVTRPLLQKNEFVQRFGFRAPLPAHFWQRARSLNSILAKLDILTVRVESHQMAQLFTCLRG
jgi:hypothetical protein